MKKLTIATRESPLAMWQAKHIQALLQQQYPELNIELLPMTTTGDQMLNGPLSQVGGKGLFVKELERALLDGRADIAVHSMKDVPPEFPEGLGLTGILCREDCRDAFVSNQYRTLADLPDGAKVGTASQRRKAQILAQYPTLKTEVIRGNLQTRLRKLDDGEFDAIILAAAGLKRMGLSERITSLLQINECLPAVGQGVLGIEARLDDAATAEIIAPLIDSEAQTLVQAERTFSQKLGGSCSVPLACHAQRSDEDCTIEGLVAEPDGSVILRDKVTGRYADAEKLAEQLADKLIAQGAKELLANLG